jgi:GxxExxY protein
MTLIYQDRTEILKRMFFEVQNEVGLGRQEKAYHQACVLWLQGEQIPFASKPPHRLMLGSDEAYVLYPDLVVGDSITIEIKALPRRLGRGEIVQLFDYLKCRDERLGLLVNMGLDRVVDQRFVYDSPATELIEDWSYWHDAIDDVQFSTRRGVSYMRSLGLLWGVAVDFGKTEARMTGLQDATVGK